MLRGGVGDVVVIVTLVIKKTVIAYISKRNNKAKRQLSHFDSLVDSSICSMGRVVLRRATPGDYDGVERISKDIYDGRDILPDFCFKYLEDLTRRAVVAELDGQIASIHTKAARHSLGNRSRVRKHARTHIPILKYYGNSLIVETRTNRKYFDLSIQELSISPTYVRDCVRVCVRVCIFNSRVLFHMCV